tara:strand:+ start:220 stop:669 length:450 start_codon:yes stop_codon:yes gene_type:complete
MPVDNDHVFLHEGTPMFRLIYISSASEEISPTDIQDILTTAVSNNRNMEITGLLMYNGLNFMQVLEGERDDVEPLFEKISQDKRHVSVASILQGDADTRIFAPWAMLFKKLKPETTEQDIPEVTMSEIMALEMPDNVRAIIKNFDNLMG